jgi:hypothetical protein
VCPLSGAGQEAAMDEFQVASFGYCSRSRLGGARLSVRPISVEDAEGGEIEDFLGQLWWVPLSPSPRVSRSPPNLFWIRHDIWESKKFNTRDCFLVHS